MFFVSLVGVIFKHWLRLRRCYLWRQDGSVEIKRVRFCRRFGDIFRARINFILIWVVTLCTQWCLRYPHDMNSIGDETTNGAPTTHLSRSRGIRTAWDMGMGCHTDLLGTVLLCIDPGMVKDRPQNVQGRGWCTTPLWSRRPKKWQKLWRKWLNNLVLVQSSNKDAWQRKLRSDGILKVLC